MDVAPSEPRQEIEVGIDARERSGKPAGFRIADLLAKTGHNAQMHDAPSYDAWGIKKE